MNKYMYKLKGENERKEGESKETSIQGRMKNLCPLTQEEYKNLITLVLGG